MNLDQRIKILLKLGAYLSSDDEALEAVKRTASEQNGWFVPAFVDLAIDNIVHGFLQEEALLPFVAEYPGISLGDTGKTVGIVMAGNIPLVGFHDFMCGFLSGHRLLLKPSSKDDALIRHLVAQMQQWEPALQNQLSFGEQLKGCDGYIATGSNNSSRYFEYYFRNYQSIIRRNRTSAAILTGNETPEALEKLADDMMLYFGLGCRNVSKLYVPKDYDFVPLLRALDKYQWMAEHHKFKNNYDYHLAIHLLNNKYYMTNGTVLLIESEQLFSPISQTNYSFYEGEPNADELVANYQEDLQCIAGFGGVSFGSAQSPAIDSFADGVDTMAFLTALQ